MMKKITVFLMMLSLLMACAGCGGGPDVPEETLENPESSESSGASVKEWTGTFTLDSGSAAHSSVCRMKQMDEALVLFELNVTDAVGEESRTAEYVMAGVMLLNEQGTEGVYETDPDALYPLVLTFSFEADSFSVEAQGDCGFDPTGHYTFTGDTVEVSEGLAVELLEQLPTAATSLTGNLGGYTVEYPENLISGWFYQVDAVLNDSGKTLGSFLVSRDLTCVIRVDEDIEPVLIWGSMDSTLQAQLTPENQEPAASSPEEPIPAEAQVQPVIWLEFDNGTVLAVDETSAAAPVLPWEFPYALELTSSDPAVVAVEGTTLRAVAEGTATVQAELTVFDSSIPYEIPVEVFAVKEIPEDLPDSDE